MATELTLASKTSIADYPKPTLEFKENSSTLGCFAVQRDEGGVATKALHTKDVQDLMAVVYKAAIKKFFEKQKDKTEFKIDPSKIEIYEYNTDCIITDGTDSNNFLSLKDIEVEDNEDLKRVFTSNSKPFATKTALSVYRYAVELMNDDRAIALSSGINPPQITPTVVNIQTTSITSIDKPVDVANTQTPKAGTLHKDQPSSVGPLHPDVVSSIASSPESLRSPTVPAASAATTDVKDQKTRSGFGDNFLSDLYSEFENDLVNTTLTKAFKKPSKVKDLKPKEINVLNKLKDKFRLNKVTYLDYGIFLNMVKHTANCIVIGGNDERGNWDEDYIKKFHQETFQETFY